MGAPLHFGEEFEVEIMIERGPERCMGPSEFPNLNWITSEPGLDGHIFKESERALFGARG